MSLGNDYAPGGCNIGAAEIQRRRRGGWAGAAMLAVTLALLAGTSAQPAWYLVLFIPAFAASIGFVQAAFRFCVYFGLASLVNFSEPGQQRRVVDADARTLDRANAWKLLGVSAAISAIVAAAAFGLATLAG